MYFFFFCLGKKIKLFRFIKRKENNFFMRFVVVNGNWDIIVILLFFIGIIGG